MEEFIKERISYYECFEKVWTREIIEDLRLMLGRIGTEKKVSSMNIDEQRAMEFLKEMKIQGAHLFKGDKLLLKAKSLGFELSNA